MENVIIECIDQICKIISPVPEPVHKEIWDVCSEQDPNYWKVPKHIRQRNPKLRHWDGYLRLYPFNTRKFRMGLVDKVTRVLFKHGFVSTVKYNVNGGQEIEYDHNPYSNRDYQHECADIMSKCRSSIARIATGGGKTYISSLVTRKISMNTVFVVRSKDLLLQAYNDYKSYFPDADIKMVGDMIVEAGDITIVMVQSLMTLIETGKKKAARKERGKVKSSEKDLDRTEKQKKAAERIRKKAQEKQEFKNALRERIVDKAKLVHIDECHMLGAETVFKIVGLFKNAINICGWSATPRRPDGRNIHLEAAAGPVVYEKPMKELIVEGYLVPPTVRYIHVEKRIERGRLGDVDFSMTKKHFNSMKYETLVEWQILHNQSRHEIVAEWANHFESNNKSCLIAVRRLEHGQVFEDMMQGSHFVHGTHPDRHDLLGDFKVGGFNTMSSTLCKEGFDAPIIEGIIIAIDLNDPEQIIGRGVRLNKDKTGCDVIHLIDDHRIFKNQLKNCREINDENEIVQIG